MFAIIITRPGEKSIREAWIRAIARPVRPKAVHVFTNHFTKDSFDESQELKRRLLGSNLKYILKPDAVPSLFPNGKAVNKRGSGYVHLFICSKLSGNKNIYDRGLRPATLLKKRLWHRCFPVNFAKFLRTPFPTEHLWWLLL